MAQITLPIDDMRQSLRTALVRSQEPITAYVGYSADDATINVPGISNLIYIYGVDGQPETAHAYFQPIKIPYAALNHRTQITIKKLHGNWWVDSVGYEGFLEQLGGGVPETNMLGFVHTHESTLQGGLLDAGLVFDSGVVDEVYGGTGQSVYAVGDLLYASTTTALSKLADVATGNALISGGIGVAPAWGKIGLTTHVSGTLPVGNGGTGAAALTANNVLLGNGTSAVQFVAPGTSGNVLTSNGTTWTSAAPSGSSPWTTTSNVIHPGVLTDAVAIGTNTNNSAKLYILEDDPGEIPLRITGAAAQTFPLLYVEDNSANALFTVSAAGQVRVNQSETTTADFVVTGQGGISILFAVVSTNTIYIDGNFIVNENAADRDWRFEGLNDSVLFTGDASTNRVGIGTSTPDGRLTVVGRADEIQTIIRGNATQTSNIFEIQDSASNVQVSVSGLGAAVFNEEGNDADTRFEGDTDQNLLFLDASADSIQIGGSAPTDWLHLKASTTARASVRLPGGTAPTSPNDGAIWNSTAQKAFFGMAAGIVGSFGRPLFTQSAVTGNNNVTSQISLLGTGVGSRTLPANFWTVGKSILVLAAGYHQTDGAKNTTWRFKAGSVELASSTSASYSAGGAGGRLWWSFFILTCYSTGASGDFWCQGRVMCHNDTNFNMWNTAVVNLNTTASMVIDETFQTTTTSSATLAFGTNALIFELN